MTFTIVPGAISIMKKPSDNSGIGLTDYQTAPWLLRLGHAADVSPHFASSLGEGAVECAEHRWCGVVLSVEEHEVRLDLEGA